MNIVDYHIEMLDVGAADAFLLMLKTSDCGNLLILIDSGTYSDGTVIVSHIRKYYSNPFINLAIISHCDDDHYGGFIRLLEKIRDREDDCIEIGEFWVNDPRKHNIDVDDVKYVQTQRTVNERLKSVYSLPSGKNLLELIDSLKIKRCEKFARPNGFGWMQTCLPISREPGFDCFTVIGPTRKYYESLILDMRNDLTAVTEGAVDTTFCEQRVQSFDDIEDDNSAHNKSSMIILFEVFEKKYLFTGDASRESFYEIPGSHRSLINGIDWLKVPHHGSDHNLDSEIIRFLSPKNAYISTKELSTKRNPNVVSSLKCNGCDVYATCEHGNVLHNLDREGYVLVKPL